MFASYDPVMGPLIPHKGRSKPLGKSRSGRHRMTDGVQPVTHRSPLGDDIELPCCGRAVSEVRAPDRITTDPAEVTCHG
jgi:hypothetical protein